ncbi:hypothetical protein FB451DRAFT_1473640 [Mycena latifolia]|nr:hypothetical protein FB451DRAFT_1473640 [Mycena latifolia]
MQLSCALARPPVLLLLLFAVTVNASSTIPCIPVLVHPLRLSPHGRSMLRNPPTVVSVAFSDYDQSWCSFPLRKFLWGQQPAVITTANQAPEAPSSPDPRSTSSSVAPLTFNYIVDGNRRSILAPATVVNALYSRCNPTGHILQILTAAFLPTTETTAKSVTDEDASISATAATVDLASYSDNTHSQTALRARSGLRLDLCDLGGGERDFSCAAVLTSPGFTDSDGPIFLSSCLGFRAKTKTASRRCQALFDREVSEKVRAFSSLSDRAVLIATRVKKAASGSLICCVLAFGSRLLLIPIHSLPPRAMHK